MAEPIIKVEKVSKKYNIYRKNIKRIQGFFFGKEAQEVKQALQNVSFNIYQGERVAIMGLPESGCSTLLKTISGVTYPSKGKIEVRGTVNAFLNVKPGFDYEFSCRENIYLKAIVVDIDRDTVKKHETEILSFAEVEDFAELPMKRATRSTPTRLALATHLLKQADVFICDEAFNAGGASSRDMCEEKLKEYMELGGDNLTVVMATNRTPFIKKAFTRGIVLEKGRIIFDGAVKSACKVFNEQKV